MDASLGSILLFSFVLLVGSSRVQQVEKPIAVPPNAKQCTQRLFHSSFAGAASKHLGQQVQYTPPTSCGSDWPLVILKWEGSCVGNETAGRIGGAWLGGAQILHTSTPAPTAQGVEWQVENDITKYVLLLQSPNTLSVVLSMISDVSPADVGVYNVNVSMVFFYYEAEYNHQQQRPLSSPGGLFPPSLVLPLNKSGLWFEIGSQKDNVSASVTIPNNSGSCYLEVFLCPAGEEQFWYKSSRPFRELEIMLDGKLVDAVWPFPVIYGGGLNASFWNPIAAIGSLNLESYFVDLSPFTAVLADGNQHKFSFSITNAEQTWYVGANLVVMPSSEPTPAEGGLIFSQTSPTRISRIGGITRASRHISHSGYSVTNGFNITDTTERQLNFMSVAPGVDGVLQHTAYKLVHTTEGGGILVHWVEDNLFPLSLAPNRVDHSFNRKFSSVVVLGDNKGEVRGANYTSIFTNHQIVKKAEVSQRLSFQNTDNENCYSRALEVVNHVLVSDDTSTRCQNTTVLM